MVIRIILYSFETQAYINITTNTIRYRVLMYHIRCSIHLTSFVYLCRQVCVFTRPLVAVKESVNSIAGLANCTQHTQTGRQKLKYTLACCANNFLRFWERSLNSFSLSPILYNDILANKWCKMTTIVYILHRIIKVKTTSIERSH